MKVCPEGFPSLGSCIAMAAGGSEKGRGTSRARTQVQGTFLSVPKALGLTARF